MPIKIRRVLIGSVCGAVVVLGLIGITGYLTGSGSRADLCRIAGIIITGRDDTAGWVTGCIAQILIAVVAGLVYAVVFEWVTRRAGPLIGLGIGAAHVLLAGIAVGFLPVSALIARGIMPPGAFLEYEGAWMVAAFVVAHVLFGVTVGGMYGSTRRRLNPAATRWTEVPITGVYRGR
jgi:hypothetical protein